MPIVRGAIPRWRISAAYSSLNARLPLPRSCVAAVELSVWWWHGTRPSAKTAVCTPRRSASIDSDWHTVTDCQLLYGSTDWHSR